MLRSVDAVPRPRSSDAAVVYPRFGAFVERGGVLLRTFADSADVAVRFFDEDGAPAGTHPMARHEGHVHEVFVAGASAGQLYKLVVDGQELPDPYARSLPRGVHGPAQVVAPLPPLSRSRRPLRLDAGEALYELHVGTFTEAGTFRGAVERLPDVAALGVTAIELLPVAAFPGQHGWGYDGVALYAPFAPYGTLAELRELIEAAHGLGLGVVLDVVYNHLGPDGCYFRAFSPSYFREEAAGTWGDRPAVDAGPFAALVLDNARFWLEEVGFDGLRLDAAHALEPGGEPHILRRLADSCAHLPGPPVLIAEDERNEPALISSFGLDGVWADDLHHVAHVLATGEQEGYYRGYRPSVADLAHTLERGWLYEGQVWPLSGEPRGKPRGDVPRSRLVTSLQNHDQVGNRALGERLSHLIDVESYTSLALLFLLAPTTPLLFMGEEWAASSPFLFFTDHHEELGKQVVEGRRKEFRGFSAFDDAESAIPSPQEETTFLRSKLLWGERDRGPHATVLNLYRRALHLRRSDEVLARPDKDVHTEARGDVLVVRYRAPEGERVLLLSFAKEPVPVAGLVSGSPLRTLLATPAAERALCVGVAGEGSRLAADAKLPPRSAALFAVEAS